MKTIRKNQWLEANKTCIATGDASAMNLMFETKNDHKLFLSLWDKYLGNMTRVINYHLAPTGWSILFDTLSETEIKDAYYKQRKKSNKAKVERTLQDVGKILSEHFRIFLSQYVRKKNQNSGRKGTLVMQRFRKYVFNEGVNFINVFEKITKLQRNNPQPICRFQADEKQYDIQREMTKESIWKSGNKVIQGLFGVKQVLKCMLPFASHAHVLRKFETNTDTPKNPPPFT